MLIAAEIVVCHASLSSVCYAVCVSISLYLYCVLFFFKHFNFVFIFFTAWHVGFGSLIRDETPAPRSGRMES